MSSISEILHMRQPFYDESTPMLSTSLHPVKESGL